MLWQALHEVCRDAFGQVQAVCPREPGVPKGLQAASLGARRGVVGGAVHARSVADSRSEDAGGPHGGRGWQRLQGEACELSGGDLVLDECEHGLAKAGWVVQRCFPGAGGLVLALEQLHPVRAQWVLAGLS